MSRKRIRHRSLNNQKTKVFLGGINGVGKSTIISKLSLRGRIQHLRGSKLLMDALGVKSQKDLEKIPTPCVLK